MKSIIETINESINSDMINESAKMVVIAIHYHDPETAYVFTNIDEKNRKKIPQVFDWNFVRNPKNIIGFSYSDEGLNVYSIADSESAMKNDCLKAITNHIKTVDRDDDNWIENFYPNMGGYYEWPNETYGEEKPEDIYKGILDSIEQSYIDGDSTLYGIIDISKQKPVVCGNVNIEFVDNFDQWLSENE